MSKKCDINIPDDINGNSPLFLATTLKQVSLSVFIEQNILSIQGSRLTVPSQIDTMKALIAAKADVNLVSFNIPFIAASIIISSHSHLVPITTITIITTITSG